MGTDNINSSSILNLPDKNLILREISHPHRILNKKIMSRLTSKTCLVQLNLRKIKSKTTKAGPLTTMRTTTASRLSPHSSQRAVRLPLSSHLTPKIKKRTTGKISCKRSTYLSSQPRRRRLRYTFSLPSPRPALAARGCHHKLTLR